MITGNEQVAPIMRADGYGSVYLGEHPSTELLWCSAPGGETLLQKWSAMAMQSIICEPEAPESATVLNVLELPATTSYNWELHYPMYVAVIAKRYAQALITELNKEV